jgi:hypothetical protein
MSAHLPLPPWHDVYRAALLEPDHDKIPIRSKCARKDLVERLRQLDPQRPEERWELDRALSALKMLALLDKTSNAA